MMKNKHFVSNFFLKKKKMKTFWVSVIVSFIFFSFGHNKELPVIHQASSCIVLLAHWVID